MYFTDDLNVAKGYTESWLNWPNPHVEKWYLNITNMFDWNKWYTPAEFEDFAGELWVNPNKIAHYTDSKNWKIYLLNWQDIKFFEEYPETDFSQQGYSNLNYSENTYTPDELSDILHNYWFDGAKGDNLEYTEYVIFDDSNQFKRKTNENPTWSDNFSKMEIGEQQQNPLIKSLIDQSIKQDVSWIRMRDDWLIVWKYHGHKEMPVKAIMENFDELKLEPEIKELLEKQYEIWEQEEFDKTLQNIK